MIENPGFLELHPWVKAAATTKLSTLWQTEGLTRACFQYSTPLPSLSLTHTETNFKWFSYYRYQWKYLQLIISKWKCVQSKRKEYSNLIRVAVSKKLFCVLKTRFSEQQNLPHISGKIPCLGAYAKHMSIITKERRAQKRCCLVPHAIATEDTHAHTYVRVVLVWTCREYKRLFFVRQIDVQTDERARLNVVQCIRKAWAWNLLASAVLRNKTRKERKISFCECFMSCCSSIEVFRRQIQWLKFVRYFVFLSCSIFN